jgi:Fe-S-cluster-containing hydrogenase component 2
VIKLEACSQCGSCLSVCPPIYAAVYRTSGELTRYEPRKPKKAGAAEAADVEEAEQWN